MKAKKENKLGSAADGECTDLNGIGDDTMSTITMSTILMKMIMMSTIVLCAIMMSTIMMAIKLLMSSADYQSEVRFQDVLMTIIVVDDSGAHNHRDW